MGLDFLWRRKDKKQESKSPKSTSGSYEYYTEDETGDSYTGYGDYYTESGDTTAVTGDSTSGSGDYYTESGDYYTGTGDSYASSGDGYTETGLTTGYSETGSSYYETEDQSVISKNKKDLKSKKSASVSKTSKSKSSAKTKSKSTSATTTLYSSSDSESSSESSVESSTVITKSGQPTSIMKQSTIDSRRFGKSSFTGSVKVGRLGVPWQTSTFKKNSRDSESKSQPFTTNNSTMKKEIPSEYRPAQLPIQEKRVTPPGGITEKITAQNPIREASLYASVARGPMDNSMYMSQRMYSPLNAQNGGPYQTQRPIPGPYLQGAGRSDGFQGIRAGVASLPGDASRTQSYWDPRAKQLFSQFGRQETQHKTGYNQGNQPSDMYQGNNYNNGQPQRFSLQQNMGYNMVSPDYERDMNQGGAQFMGRGAQFMGRAAPFTGRASPGFGRGMPNMGRGMPNMGRGMPNMGRGMPNMGRGMPNMGRGMPNMGRGMPDMGRGMPDMGRGMPDMGRGMPDMGRGRSQPGRGLYNKGGPTMGIGKPPIGRGGPPVLNGKPYIGRGGPSMGRGQLNSPQNNGRGVSPYRGMNGQNISRSRDVSNQNSPDLPLEAYFPKKNSEPRKSFLGQLFQPQKFGNSRMDEQNRNIETDYNIQPATPVFLPANADLNHISTPNLNRNQNIDNYNGYNNQYLLNRQSPIQNNYPLMNDVTYINQQNQPKFGSPECKSNFLISEKSRNNMDTDALLFSTVVSLPKSELCEKTCFNLGLALGQICVTANKHKLVTLNGGINYIQIQALESTFKIINKGDHFRAGLTSSISGSVKKVGAALKAGVKVGLREKPSTTLLIEEMIENCRVFVGTIVCKSTKKLYAQLPLNANSSNKANKKALNPFILQSVENNSPTDIDQNYLSKKKTSKGLPSSITVESTGLPSSPGSNDTSYMNSSEVTSYLTDESGSSNTQSSEQAPVMLLQTKSSLTSPISEVKQLKERELHDSATTLRQINSVMNNMTERRTIAASKMTTATEAPVYITPSHARYNGSSGDSKGFVNSITLGSTSEKDKNYLASKEKKKQNRIQGSEKAKEFRKQQDISFSDSE